LDFLACSCGCGGELHSSELAPEPLVTVRVLADPAPAPIVTLDNAKLHLRVTSTTEDTLIAQYVAAAQLAVAAYCEASLTRQRLEALVGGVSASREPVVLPLGPVAAVQTVESVAVDGTRTPITGWQASGPVVAPPAGESWPAAPALVAVTYDAGPDEPEAPAQLAVLLLIGQYYDHRAPLMFGSIAPAMPYTVDFLLAQYRRSSGITAA
jgi:uncharacterized phiE125 gp8 family phage protein